MNGMDASKGKMKKGINGNLKTLIFTILGTFICWLAYQQWEDIKFRNSGALWTETMQREYEIKVLREQMSLRQYIDQKFGEMGVDELRRRLLAIEVNTSKLQTELVEIRLLLASHTSSVKP